MPTHVSLCLAIGLAASLSLPGCAKDPSKDVAAAKVREPSATTKKPAPTAEPAAAKPAAANPVAAAKPGAAAPAAKPAAGLALSGDVVFIGSKVTGSHECKFNTWTGSFALAGGEAEGGSLNISIDMASVVADYKKPTPVWSAKLTGHLKSGEFFDVAHFAKSTFTSTEIKLGGVDGKGTHTIVGKLTIRGTTKDITFPATIKVSDGKIDAAAKFSINRKDFGIAYPGKKDDLIRDGVVLALNFKG